MLTLGLVLVVISTVFLVAALAGGSDDPAGFYLHARTGLTVFPDCLRFAPDVRYVDVGTKPSWHPVMVALVEPCETARAEGQPNALHRTYLDRFGNKADVPCKRKMLGTMPTGAAVRLMPHRDVLGIAEGLETAMSASILFKVPVWAALSDGLLQDWVPPPNVRTVLIFGDNDESFAGQTAAYTLAKRLKAKGLTTSVELPVRSGTDWNDVYLQTRRSTSP